MESNMIRKAKAGDAQALTKLVDSHKELAFNIALRITDNVQDAEDIVQESFLKALKNLTRFREESKFSSWLYKIVYNEAIAYIKKQKRATDFLDAPFSEPIHEKENDSYSDNYQKLFKAIDQLSITERNIIELFYLGDKSIKDIQNIVGKNPSNIKVILHRARLKMQKILKNE
ncbi:MAG: RNA polymerase sigma factor [Cyclobacteriaceae bacterium]|nr:RNA polymerase sigma factor [Cyclobacteriaceae bacterium HetDA_MAG_MS6]